MLSREDTFVVRPVLLFRVLEIGQMDLLPLGRTLPTSPRLSYMESARRLRRLPVYSRSTEKTEQGRKEHRIYGVFRKELLKLSLESSGQGENPTKNQKMEKGEL